MLGPTFNKSPTFSVWKLKLNSPEVSCVSLSRPTTSPVCWWNTAIKHKALVQGCVSKQYWTKLGKLSVIPFDAGSETSGLGGRERLYKHQRGTGGGVGRDGQSQGRAISNQSHTTTSYPGPTVVSKLVCSVAVTENSRAGPYAAR